MIPTRIKVGINNIHNNNVNNNDNINGKKNNTLIPSFTTTFIKKQVLAHNIIGTTTYTHNWSNDDKKNQYK